MRTGPEAAAELCEATREAAMSVRRFDHPLRNASLRPGSVPLVALLVGLSLTLAVAQAANAQITCADTGKPHEVPEQVLLQPAPAEQPDLLIDGNCTVVSGKKYYYANVNIRNGGTLSFPETAKSATDFWASSIIIENGGSLTAGDQVPFGTKGGVLTIHLYGMDQSDGDPVKNPGQGVLCKSALGKPRDPTRFTPAPCGIGQTQWESNGASLQSLPGDVSDFFYQYGPLYGDGLCDNKMAWMNDKCPDNSNPPPGVPVKGTVGYFGYKVLAVSYGGTLALRGNKGASYDAATNNNPASSGASWIRLDSSVAKGTTTLMLDQPPNNTWAKGDKIVVTTTDYLPAHSEQLTINEVEGKKVTLDAAIQWPHNGERYGGPSSSNPLMARLPDRIKNSMDSDLVKNGAETRAAVALLTRSIRIVSEGDTANETFEQASSRTLCPDGKTHGCYYFGAHTVFRQGFLKLQIQGVEFAQMGQGGRLAHYPVHFHMARQTPPGTFVKDSSVNESMTRWYVVHATQGVTLARNVGWKSIGHGYYIEAASETDNNFYSNIGIFARAAVDNGQNDRKVPGILSYNDVDFPGFPYRSDNEYPSVFWITNGWNDFIGNMAAGAGTCGACYWFEPAENSDMVDVPDNLPPPANCPSDGMHTYMQWSGYAGLQKHQCTFNPNTGNRFSTPSSFAGTTPLKSFYKNYCSSAEHSFQTTSDAPACDGIWAAKQGKARNILTGVPSIAPKPTATVSEKTSEADDPYYPHYIGARSETRCPLVNGKADCSNAVPCANGAAEQCGVTVLDHYTSAFNWANGNIAAVWLRPKWYLIDNSVLSDVQNSGLTFVTSGTYDRTAVIEGDWALARNTVFIGTTQPGNPYASNAGPFNQGGPLKSDLKCEDGDSPTTGYCLNINEGISMPLASFFVNQRLFSIYDGPSYEDSNVYLDITTTSCADTDCMYAKTNGIRKGTGAQQCYLPNAAIGWKQPNGFFYPPAFHSTNLFFDHVDIRHYVIDALWNPRTYLSNTSKIADEYCNPSAVSFGNYSDIDRQTELNDDDGSLTGLTNNVKPKPTGTISVNPDTFFSAPVETPECLSNVGVKPTATCDIAQETPTTATTSPYDYVTTAVIADCGLGGPAVGKCGSQTMEQKDPNNPARVLMSVGRGGTWSKECTNPACYGIPLYRQFLTGNDGTNGKPATREWATWFANGCNTANPPDRVKCRFPFVRMSGQSTYQRSTLTVNHGTYYLDTTVPRDVQYGSSPTMQGEPFTDIIPCEFKAMGACQPRSVNGFEGGHTYYVFFLYAKSGTHATQQTYQIYVGPKAQGFNVNTDISAVQVNLNTPVEGASQTQWPAGWTKNYNDAVACGPNNPDCGLLQVTVDFTNINLDLTSANGLCQPHTFCELKGNSCGCAFDKSDPRAQASSDPEQVVKECDYVCSEWAVKDLDFPDNGINTPKYFAWGFSFKLPPGPSGFMPDATLTNPSPHRPQPIPFPPTTPPTGKQDWTTKFTNTSKAPDDATGGQCFYAKVPGTDCPVP